MAERWYVLIKLFLSYHPRSQNRIPEARGTREITVNIESAVSFSQFNYELMRNPAIFRQVLEVLFKSSLIFNVTKRLLITNSKKKSE